MNADQIAQRLFNTIRGTVARNDISTQLDVYQALLDEIDREMGRLEEESSVEDERFSQDTSYDDEDESP